MIVSLGRELLCRADISKDEAETLHFRWGRNTPFRSGAEPGSRDWMSDWRCQLEQVGVCFLTWRTLLRIAPFSASEHTSLWEKAQRPENTLAVGTSRYPVSRNVDGC